MRPRRLQSMRLFSWTGFYLGGNIGGAWANRDVTDTFLGVNFNNGNNNGVFIGEANSGSTGKSATISFSDLKRTSMGLRITTTPVPYSFLRSEVSR